jgi:hypothetical protein
LSWLEELGSGCSERLVDEICGPPDDTEIERLGTRDEEGKVSVLLSAPVADAVDRSEDVDRLVLAGRLDDGEIVLKVST